MGYKYNPAKYRTHVVAKKARRAIIKFLAMENGKTIKLRAYKALKDFDLAPVTIDGHFQTLAKAGLIVRNELTRAEGVVPPSGKVEKFIWKHLPTTRREVQSAATQHFSGLTARDFGKVYKAMYSAGMFVRQQYELTVIGEYVLHQIQLGKEGDPAELIPEIPPNSAKKAIRFKCGHTEIIDIPYWTPEDISESIQQESAQPCPKCRDG